ncbi:MAG: DUF2269 domain-containing protein [Actinobacteria bacterium]|nr:DUF2269 domain-containing protein [Actinomycetota bacterium]
MTLSPGVRKTLLAVHLTASIGWIGGIIAYIVLGTTAINATDAKIILSAWIAMEVIGWIAIVPLAGASWVTGVAMALGTRWGLFRHYWVIISLAITSVALVVLLLHMPDVTTTVEFARTASAPELATLGGDLVHPTLGLILLLVVQVLNIYKPRGLTRYGRRRQRPSGSSG